MKKIRSGLVIAGGDKKVREDLIMQLKRRDGLLSAIFGILTCGIYRIYFWFRYGDDVNVICADDGKETMNYIVAWLLSIFTCGIYGLYWTYNLASRLDTASRKYDVNVESPVFFTLFMNIPFLSYFYACDVMNKFADKYEAIYPDGNGGYGGPLPPYNNGGGNGQSLGSQIGSQFKSAVSDMGSGIKNSAQTAMNTAQGAMNTSQGTANSAVITCRNCGAVVPQGKNYCKQCGYPVNGSAPQNTAGSFSTQAPVQPKPAKAPAVSEPLTPNAPEIKSTQPQSEPVKPAQSAGIPQMNIPPAPQPTPPTQQTLVCPKCGKTVKPGDSFCIHCGSKIL